LGKLIPITRRIHLKIYIRNLFFFAGKILLRRGITMGYRAASDLCRRGERKYLETTPLHTKCRKIFRT
jgi:hypothetical protein